MSIHEHGEKVACCKCKEREATGETKPADIILDIILPARRTAGKCLLKLPRLSHCVMAAPPHSSSCLVKGQASHDCSPIDQLAPGTTRAHGSSTRHCQCEGSFRAPAIKNLNEISRALQGSPSLTFHWGRINGQPFVLRGCSDHMLDMGECCFPVPVSGLASDGPTLTLHSSRSRACGDGQGVRGRRVTVG